MPCPPAHQRNECPRPSVQLPGHKRSHSEGKKANGSTSVTFGARPVGTAGALLTHVNHGTYLLTSISHSASPSFPARDARKLKCDWSLPTSDRHLKPHKQALHRGLLQLNKWKLRCPLLRRWGQPPCTCPQAAPPGGSQILSVPPSERSPKPTASVRPPRRPPGTGHSPRSLAPATVYSSERPRHNHSPCQLEISHPTISGHRRGYGCKTRQ